ncbi:histidine kinase dimerization/phosphoacceptor domain -containing protein [Patiriisocius hiemis]|uniref:histidine kinase n=1 Tax=Patiriisocius hiemis TaxID=3075604 RepID=A0ABU2YF86_9FLAO|nr:histidine kinase dimerization/phosphoacceptor domain -containing protein [Constantimarinum sp. W242]MDT0556677.1 histidine kinase dimerization/phosphoacceptor domain -containing protein [Constantimarinum sp. W242]
MNKLFFLVFSIHFIFGWAQEVDSLAQFYNDKTWEYIIKENDSALYYANKGISISKAESYAYGEMINLEYRGIYKEAVENDYEGATQDYISAIAIAEVSHPEYLPDLYISMGILFAKMGDDSKAISYLQQAVSISNKENRSYMLALVNLAIIQSRLGQYEKANSNFEEFLEVDGLTLREKDAAILGIGKNLTRQKKYKEAEPYYLEAILPDSLNGGKRYAQHYSDLLDNYLKLKDVKAVSKYLPIMTLSYDSVKALREIQVFYISATNAYKLLDRPDLALQYQDSLLMVKDSLSQKKYSEQVTELETQYQTQQKEAQILVAKKRQKTWYYIAGGVAFGLLIVAFLLFNNIKKRKELLENKKTLEKTLKQRNMLLRETHHRVKNSFQMVSGLLQLQATETTAKDAVLALEGATQRVNSMILLHQQLYSKDDLLGVELNKYMEDLLSEIKKTSDRVIEYKTNITHKILDVDITTSLGLLVNELATNSIKYAHSNSQDLLILLNISEIEDGLEFTMYDNGREMDATTKNGYGTELISLLIDRLDAKKQPLKEHPFGLRLIIPLT